MRFLIKKGTVVVLHVSYSSYMIVVLIAVFFTNNHCMQWLMDGIFMSHTYNLLWLQFFLLVTVGVKTMLT